MTTTAATLRTEPLDIQTETTLANHVFGSTWFAALPAAVQAAYRRFPPWYLYELVDGGAPVRVVGINELPDGGTSLDTCVALLLMTNRTVGGRPESSVRRVPRWTADHLARIRMRAPDAAAVFADPLGFVELAGGCGGGDEDDDGNDDTQPP